MNFALSKRSSNKSLKKIPVQGAAAAVSEFTKGGRVVGLTKGQFSLLHLILQIIEITGPADIIISTWSAGLYDASVLHQMLDSGLIRDIQLITDRSYYTRQKRYAVSIEEAFGRDRIRTTNMHAKFVLIKNGDWNVCIRSSMNLNENKRCENFDIDDDVEIFDFYKAFVDEVFAEMPAGFTEERNTVDLVFDSLMGGALIKKKNKSGFTILDKFGKPLFSEI